MEYQIYLESQFLNPNFADIYFVIQENDEQRHKIPAHKVILAASSPFFQKYFQENVDLKKIELANSTMEAFKEFLFTFYSENTEKYFTIANASKVLTLAKQFGTIRCIKLHEKFLVKNLSINQICFGYALAVEFNLSDLKASCRKQINEKTFEAFTSQSFYSCNQDVLFDILNNMTVTQLEAKKLVFDACMIWAEKQCAESGMNSSDLKIRRDLLGKCFNSIKLLIAKDGELKNYVMEHYTALFNDDELSDNNQSTAIVFNHDLNQNEIVELEILRLHETMLATQLCSANAPIIMVINSTKRIILNGFAFATTIGVPHGKFIITKGSNDSTSKLVVQKIVRKNKRREPRNFIAVDDVIFEPNQDYTIKLQLTKDVVYYQNRSVSNVYNANGFTVSFQKQYGRDIFSHFFFNDCF